MSDIKLKEDQIAFIIHKKTVSKRSWDDISMMFEKKFDIALDVLELKSIYQKYANVFETDEEYSINKLKQIARTKKSNSFTSKENRTIIQAWNDRDDILDAVKEAAKHVGKLKIRPEKRKKSKKK